MSIVIKMLIQEQVELEETARLINTLDDDTNISHLMKKVVELINTGERPDLIKMK